MLLSTNNNDKYTLIKLQLQDLIILVLINEMYECGYNRQQIKNSMKCIYDTIGRWKTKDFNCPKAFIESQRTVCLEVSREIEKSVLNKRKNEKFSTRKVAI